MIVAIPENARDEIREEEPEIEDKDSKWLCMRNCAFVLHLTSRNSRSCLGNRTAKTYSYVFSAYDGGSREYKEYWHRGTKGSCKLKSTYFE